MIKYRKLSYERKSIIKEAYFKILDLDLPSNKIHYMKVTKCLDENWEINLVGEMTKNSKLEEAYVEVVNSSDKLTKNTVNVLCKLNTIHSMSVLVNQEFLKRKKYNYYIVSETKGKARFDLAEGELLEELWSTYIKIFSGDGYKYTRKHMAQNHDFLHRIMNEKLYKGLPEENRMQLKGIYQDKDSIIDVMEYGVEFALKYYSSIAGFSDENAATAFVDIVEKSPKLIASDELYKHTYDMLVSSKLKGRYTLIRKRNGYTN